MKGGLYNRTLGFTLIELLVVISITGLFSSIIVASLVNLRDNAKIASIRTSMKNSQAAALLCMDSGINLNPPAVGNLVCAGSETLYGSLPSGWIYGGVDGDVSDYTFAFIVRPVSSAKKWFYCFETRCFYQ